MKHIFVTLTDEEYEDLERFLTQVYLEDSELCGEDYHTALNLLNKLMVYGWEI